MDRLGVRNVARQARYFDAELEQAIQLILDFAVFRGLEWESPGISLSPLNYHFDFSILMRVLLSMVSGHATSTQQETRRDFSREGERAKSGIHA